MANQRMNTSKLSDEDIQDMFTEVYEKNVASQNNFNAYECICKRDVGDTNITMEVTVNGMAGSPTINDYKTNKVKGSGSITIEREGRGFLTFKLQPKEIMILNSNDYLAIYKAE